MRAPWRGILVVVAAVSLSSCGTRLPDSAFVTASAPPTATTNANPASDVGVTANQITVGIMSSATGPLGSGTFSPPSYGARAYFEALDARGGVNGRTIKVVTCDDQSSGSGDQSCVHQLIDDQKVFALTATSVLDYAGAPYVNTAGVPDVGGQPIGTAYDQYPHLYSIIGSNEPRTGESPGWNGKLAGGTEVYRWVKERLGAHVAAVVYYNQQDSARFAGNIADALETEGFRVLREQVDFALPNFTSVALDMKAHGVQAVFDALDSGGNGDLCKAIDAQSVNIVAKVTTVQGWNATVRSDYADSPKCRNVLYATANDQNYEDTSVPVVKQFRDDMARYFPDREGELSMWELEGWAAAQWLTDAIRSCDAQVTRQCVEAFVTRPQGYDGHGLMIPVNFNAVPTPPKTLRSCFNVARWQDSANSGRGAWVTQVADMTKNCFDVPQLLYSP